MQPCPFRHSQEIHRQRPRPPGCAQWSNFVCNNPACEFVHGDPRPPPTAIRAVKQVAQLPGSQSFAEWCSVSFSSRAAGHAGFPLSVRYSCPSISVLCMPFDVTVVVCLACHTTLGNTILRPCPSCLPGIQRRGVIAVFWDMLSCPVPYEGWPYGVALGIQRYFRQRGMLQTGPGWAFKLYCYGPGITPAVRYDIKCFGLQTCPLSGI